MGADEVDRDGIFSAVIDKPADPLVVGRCRTADFQGIVNVLDSGRGVTVRGEIVILTTRSIGREIGSLRTSKNSTGPRRLRSALPNAPSAF